MMEVVPAILVWAHKTGGPVEEAILLASFAAAGVMTFCVDGTAITGRSFGSAEVVVFSKKKEHDNLKKCHLKYLFYLLLFCQISFEF